MLDFIVCFFMHICEWNLLMNWTYTSTFLSENSVFENMIMSDPMPSHIYVCKCSDSYPAMWNTCTCGTWINHVIYKVCSIAQILVFVWVNISLIMWPVVWLWVIVISVWSLALFCVYLSSSMCCDKSQVCVTAYVWWQDQPCLFVWAFIRCLVSCLAKCILLLYVGMCV